jgi:DNA transposition AAA+ family ATPase
MRVNKEDRHRLGLVSAPGTQAVRAALAEYLGVMDLTTAQFAERVGRGESTINIFLQGRYARVAADDTMMRRLIWDYLERNPIAAGDGDLPKSSGRLFHTRNCRIISQYLASACDEGEVCLLYGPPGTQKTFVLSHMIAGRNLEKKNPALYIYASVGMTPRAMLKRIGRAAGVFVNLSGIERVLSSVLAALRSKPRPPAIVVDEAQHLQIASLEILRELHDRSGCGLVLAGSHTLYQSFLRSKAQLEQWLSRIDHKEPLPGLLEDEVREISSRELGNGQPAKIGGAQMQMILAACRTEDIFAHGLDGKQQPMRYLSARRLVKFLGQLKKKKEAAA